MESQEEGVDKVLEQESGLLGFSNALCVALEETVVLPSLSLLC